MDRAGRGDRSEAKVRARGTRGQNWYSDKRVSFIRSKVRVQSSWLLHLAGDFHGSFETKQVLHKSHLMRVMLTSNLAVDQRFANGTQGRLLHFSPSDAAVEQSKKAVPASHPNICARFVKESSLQKRGHFLPDIDMMDCQVRQENLNMRGEPIMLQLPLAYFKIADCAASVIHFFFLLPGEFVHSRDDSQYCLRPRSL